MDILSVKVHAIVVAMLLGIVPMGARFAIAGDDGSEIRELRDEIQRLNRKVDELERQRSSDAPPAAVLTTEPPPVRSTSAPLRAEEPPVASRSASPPGTVSLGDLWKNLRRGMSEEQVSELLGAPTHKLQANDRPLWYYEYAGLGSGSVVFSRDRVVADWQRPPLGLWGLW